MYEDIKDIPQLNNLFLTLNEPYLKIVDVDVDTNAKGTRKETKIIGKTIETYLQDKKKHVSTITALQSEEPPVELPANKYDITNVNEITSLDELDILKQDYNIVIALLSSDAGCSGCDIIKPIYKDLANNNTNNNIIFVKINADLIENEAEINEIKEYFRGFLSGVQKGQVFGLPSIVIHDKLKDTNNGYMGPNQIKTELTKFLAIPPIAGGANKYKKTNKKITVIYKKKEYIRVIYICEGKKYVKINKSFILLSKLKKI
jgi:thiol-disulfide isomerase/thioredoxin